MSKSKSNEAIVIDDGRAEELRELFCKRTLIEAAKKASESAIKSLDVAIADLVEQEMESVLFARKQEFGQATFEIPGAGKFSVEIGKTVSYDSNRLAAVAAQMPEADAGELFDAKLTMSEENFELLSECDHPLLAEIIAARSVRYSKPRLKNIRVTIPEDEG